MTDVASHRAHNSDWSEREQILLRELSAAEKSGDRLGLEVGVYRLALFYSSWERFEAAVPYWRRGAELTVRSTAPDAREFATYLYNMARLCLIPGGLREEARTVLCQAREIFGLHFRSEAQVLRDVEELLEQIAKGH